MELRVGGGVSPEFSSAKCHVCGNPSGDVTLCSNCDKKYSREAEILSVLVKRLGYPPKPLSLIGDGEVSAWMYGLPYIVLDLIRAASHEAYQLGYGKLQDEGSWDDVEITNYEWDLIFFEALGGTDVGS